MITAVSRSHTSRANVDLIRQTTPRSKHVWWLCVSRLTLRCPGALSFKEEFVLIQSELNGNPLALTSGTSSRQGIRRRRSSPSLSSHERQQPYGVSLRDIVHGDGTAYGISLGLGDNIPTDNAANVVSKQDCQSVISTFVWRDQRLSHPRIQGFAIRLFPISCLSLYILISSFHPLVSDHVRRWCKSRQSQRGTYYVLGGLALP
jgi:hypothetical protein